MKKYKVLKVKKTSSYDNTDELFNEKLENLINLYAEEGFVINNIKTQYPDSDRMIFYIFLEREKN